MAVVRELPRAGLGPAVAAGGVGLLGLVAFAVVAATMPAAFMLSQSDTYESRCAVLSKHLFTTRWHGRHHLENLQLLWSATLAFSGVGSEGLAVPESPREKYVTAVLARSPLDMRGWYWEQATSQVSEDAFERPTYSSEGPTIQTVAIAPLVGNATAWERAWGRPIWALDFAGGRPAPRVVSEPTDAPAPRPTFYSGQRAFVPGDDDGRGGGGGDVAPVTYAWSYGPKGPTAADEWLGADLAAYVGRTFGEEAWARLKGEHHLTFHNEAAALDTDQVMLLSNVIDADGRCVAIAVVSRGVPVALARRMITPATARTVAATDGPTATGGWLGATRNDVEAILLPMEAHKLTYENLGTDTTKTESRGNCRGRRVLSARHVIPLFGVGAPQLTYACDSYDRRRRTYATAILALALFGAVLIPVAGLVLLLDGPKRSRGPAAPRASGR